LLNSVGDGASEMRGKPRLPGGPFLLRALAIRGCERAFVVPVAGVVASDHYALVADLDPMPVL